MDTFSLEDDDYDDLFITQSSKEDDNSNVTVNGSQENMFSGVKENDFSSPCSSILNGNCDSANAYSDISDYEDESNEVVNFTDR